MFRQLNRILLCGTVDGTPVLSHISRGVRYYVCAVRTRRLSGAEDRLNVIFHQSLLSRVPEDGQRVSIEGELRSFRSRAAAGPRLLIHVYARELLPPESEDRNEVQLSGSLCREPSWRRTPMGREICDLMLSVPRRCGRYDHIPAIAWGRSAAEAAAWEKNHPVLLTGRFQSRSYLKVTENGSEERTAYEVSVTEFADEECE